MSLNARMDQLELFKAHADGIDAAFYEFNRDNPHIYQLILKFAREAKAAGRTRFGMKMIFERVRWYTSVETNDATGLKLNNNYTSRFARLVDEQEADLKGLFEFRELQTPTTLKKVA